MIQAPAKLSKKAKEWLRRKRKRANKALRQIPIKKMKIRRKVKR